MSSNVLPRRKFSWASLLGEPFVEKEDGSEIVLVTDDATDGLVHGAKRLQIVPEMQFEFKIDLS